MGIEPTWLVTPQVHLKIPINEPDCRHFAGIAFHPCKAAASLTGWWASSLFCVHLRSFDLPKGQVWEVMKGKPLGMQG